MGSVTRLVRLRPPATPNFALLGTKYPSGAREASGLAPGMVLECTIAFQPSHLGSYKDELCVQPEGSLPFTVQLCGERHPPGLTLPDELHCGATLVGRPGDRVFPFRNTGGEGRCRLIAADSLRWEVAMHMQQETGVSMQTSEEDASASRQTSPLSPMKRLPMPDASVIAKLPASFWQAPAEADTAPLQLKGGTFALAPAFLDLKEGQQGRLRVRFTPEHLGMASADFLAVYDNGETRELVVKGVGETSRVSVEGLSGAVDVHGRPVLLLGGVLPGHRRQHRLTVTNNSRLRLSLAWCLAAPPDGRQWPPQAPGALAADAPDSSRVASADGALQLSPAAFSLDAGEAIDVTVTFEPGSRHPAPALAAAQLAVHQVRDDAEHADDAEDAAAAAAAAPLSIVDSFLLEGRCSLFRVSAEPAAVAFGAECAVSETYTALVTLVNESAESVGFGFLPCVTSTGSVVPMPATGTIPAHSHVRVQVRLRPRRTGELHATLRCALSGGGVVAVPVLATLAEPPLLISPAALRMGTMRLGRTVTARFTISNPYSVASCVSLGARHLDGTPLRPVQTDHGSGLSSDGCPVVLSFSPSTVMIAPGEDAAVDVTLTTVREGLINLALTAQGAGPSLAVAVTGTVFKPRCLFAESELYFPGLFVGKVATTRAILRNATPVATRWSWNRDTILPFEKDTPLEAYKLAVSPAQGTLAPGESITLHIHLTPRQEETGSGVFLLFDVEDMPRPLPLLVRASVRELFVSARLLPLAANTMTLPALHESPPPRGAPPPEIDFGDVMLQQASCRILRLCNWGPVATTVYVDAAHLRTVDLEAAGADVKHALVTQTLSPQQEELDIGSGGRPAHLGLADGDGRQEQTLTPRRSARRSRQARSTLSSVRQSRGSAVYSVSVSGGSRRTTKTAGGATAAVPAVRLKKTSAETAFKVLYHTGTRHGAVFAPAQREIRLPGSSCVDVPIFTYVNGFGLYEDVLVVAGQGVPPLAIPLRVHAAGSPLTTSIGGRGQVTPLLRLPHCAVGVRHDAEEQAPGSSGGAHSTRPLSVHNESPLPIAVEWEPCFMPSRAPQAIDLLSRWEEEGTEPGLESGATEPGSGRFRLRLSARMFEGEQDSQIFRVRNKRHIVPPGATAEVLVSFTAVEEGTFHGLLRGRVRVATEEELAEHLLRTGSLRATALAPREVLNQTRAQAASMGVRPAVTPAPRALRMWTEHPPVSALWQKAHAALRVAPWRVTRRPDLAQVYDVRLLLSGEGVGPALQLSTERAGLLFEVAANDLEALADNVASLETPSWRQAQQPQPRRGRRISHAGMDWTLGPNVQGGARAHRTLTMWNTTTVTQRVHAEVSAPFAVYIMASEAQVVQRERSFRARSGLNSAAAAGRKEELESSLTKKKLLEGSLAGVLGMTQPILAADSNELQLLRGPLTLLPGSAATVAVGWRPPDGGELVEHMAKHGPGGRSSPTSGASPVRRRRRSTALRGGLAFLTDATRPPNLSGKRGSAVFAAKKWRAQTKVSEHAKDAAFDIQATLLLRPEVGDLHEVPLQARVLLPRLKASAPRIDFDDSLVGNPHVRTIVVENQGRSACNWTAHLENESEPGSRVFKCIPDAGMLEASLNKISDTRATLKVG